ncbi:MAG TPA: ABC transporter permease [Steroidobacteraceae bacterium]|jgi:sodium transport system permease protein|nr:ABC transporter permease [Steroidobacteraceae bacterium]
MNASLVVLLKEVRENLRDKRTLVNALVTGPLLAPLMFIMITNVVISRQLNQAEAPLELPVIGASNAPNLLEALRQQGFDPQPSVADPIAAVRNRDAPAVLRIPGDFGKSWIKGDPAQVEVYYDSSRRDMQQPVNRLRNMLERYSRLNGAMRLVARGLSPALANPVLVDERDQSTPRSRAGALFSILPYFFVLTVFIGGMYLAIDLTAGERERQSLEPLFANPVPRWRILLGKIGAICLFSVSSLLICVTAFTVAGHLIPTQKLGMDLGLGPAFALEVVVLMLPLVLLVAALQTLVAAFSKSYREAQTYLGILMIVPVLPSVLLSLMPVKTMPWMYAVPLLSQQVGITELLMGGSMTAAEVATCLLCGFLIAALTLAVTARVYGSERLAISV